MKKLLLLFTALLVFTMADAQKTKVGAKFGLSTSDFQASSLMIQNSAEFQDLKLDVANANYGVQLGLFLQARVGKRMFIQPEVLFNSSSVDYELTDFKEGSTFPRIMRETYNNVDIPIMTGLKLGPLRLQAGPVGHVFVSSKSELLSVDGYEQDFSKFTLGYQAGIGLDIWKFVIDVKHEGSFNNAGDHFTFFGRDYAFDKKQSRMVFSLGYAF